MNIIPVSILTNTELLTNKYPYIWFGNSSAHSLQYLNERLLVYKTLEIIDILAKSEKPELKVWHNIYYALLAEKIKFAVMKQERSLEVELITNSIGRYSLIKIADHFGIEAQKNEAVACRCISDMLRCAQIFIDEENPELLKRKSILYRIQSGWFYRIYHEQNPGLLTDGPESLIKLTYA